MKKQLFILTALIVVGSMLLTACGTTTPAAGGDTAVPSTGTKLVRWSIGIGTGADPAQVTIENEVAADFNALNEDIHLVIEVIPNASARDTIATEIAAGAGPDIVGPVGWIGSNAFAGQWLDIAPYMEADNYDDSGFEPALMTMYQTEEGTVGLPFAVYPSALYYNVDLFQEAGLNPPPAAYDTQYQMADGTMVDWTWDTLTTVAQAMTIDSNGVSSGQEGFDKTKIVQYGFSFGWEGHPNYWGNFMSNGGQWLNGSEGNYTAVAPELWKTAWQWVYDGIWGAAPYIPNGAVSGGADFGSGNVFISGKIAMVDLPSWYLCCVGDLVNVAGNEFDFGAMPISLDGKVAGRVDADTFRIWKGTKNPQESWEVLKYLIDVGIQKLVVGTPDRKPAYGAIPAQTANQGPWLDSMKAAWPFVQNWDVLIAGLAYPDVPSGEGYMPNQNEAWARIQTFGDLLVNTEGVDMAAEVATLESDLTTIFNK
jgi:multiple sugar transport system substrate-binding protein